MAHSTWRLTRSAPVLRLGAPMVAYYLVQNLASLACLALLGRLGTATLAGFGAAGAILGVVLALLYGFDTAVQTLVSRATGAGDRDRIGQVLAEALATSIPLGLVLTCGLWWLGPPLVAGMLIDDSAANAGGAYLQAWAPTLALLALTVPINAAWIGAGRPAIAFLVTLLTAPAQAALTWLLVFGAGPIAPQGVAGAGAASVIACLGGAALQLGLIARLRLAAGWRWPSAAGVLRILAVGWPVSLQQSCASLGLMLAYAIVAQLGAGGAAVINVLLSLTMLTVQTAIGLGVAAATLVGQSLGRGDADEARGWGWRAMRIGVLLTGPFGLVAAVAPEPLLRLFLHDAPTLALAILPARLVGLGVAADTIVWVLCFALRGAGATKTASAAPFVRLWLIQLPLMWWIGLGLRQGVLGVVAVQTALTVAEAAVLAAIWASRFWIPAGLRAKPANLPADVRHVAILGGAGSGKSTLARRLGPLVGAPVVHLDRLVFGPGWARNPPEVVRERLAPLLGERWVVEGTYAEAAALTLPTADLVIWLDQPAWRRLWRAWRKTRDHRGRPRADRPDGCEEGFGWPYARMVLSFGRWSPAVERWLKSLGAAEVVRLQGDREAARLLAALDQPQLSTAPARRAATGLLREAG
ncbi:MAG TPA: MATE family efflux transporter [Caulobacteraceae bacterium]|nr:MATE family efflux transporter [Caulobacteraceae bacterium]